MITQKYVIVKPLHFFATLNGIFCIKIKYFKKNDFFYYIQHQLLALITRYFNNANQNKIFNWIKVNH